MKIIKIANIYYALLKVRGITGGFITSGKTRHEAMDKAFKLLEDKPF